MAMQLSIEGVWHAFDDLQVLEDIGFTVGDGETVVVIGPSGCGKSTLLGIIGGLLAPSRGRVALRGTTAASLNPFTYVFQDFALLPWRTVEQNVSLVLEHHGLDATERRERTARCLARTGLSEFSRALPRQLSGGMRQRVGIARALAVDPAVLLMDEPLSSLDAQTRELLMEDFIGLWEEQRTATVYVTHNLDEAVMLADRVVVLSRRPGRIKEEIAIDIPRRQRQAAPAAIAEIRATLWRHIRAEAQLADREVERA
jgi:NitT/TauT family transport system ATP-binding protein